MLSALRGKGFINADYCYRGAVERGVAPFDWNTFVANPARLRVQAFERDTGRSVCWGKEDCPTVGDLIDRVRASSTLPWIMDPIELDGQVMFDGGLGAGAGLPLCLAEQEGYEKFLFLATRPLGYRKQPYTGATRRMILRLTADYPHLREAILTRAERYNTEMERIQRLADDGKCLIVRPDAMPVSSLTLDTNKLDASFYLGRTQALRDLPQWEEFLFG